MSFFGGNNNSNPANDALRQAKLESEVMSEFFGKMTNMCSKKCITSYNDGELNVGELACIDRCTSKYLQAHEKVGAHLQEFERQMMAQMGQAPPGR